MPPEGRAKRLFWRLDHAAIFLFIAGSYTPFSLGMLTSGHDWLIFGLIWGVALDWSIWRTLPAPITWLGAAVIIASGIFLIRRERVHGEAEHP